MSARLLRWLSHLCFVLGFASIAGSFIMWAVTRGDGSPEALAHAERWGIFVGLWVPSFWALSVRFDRYADKMGSSRAES
jgi:hypothetical protein